MEDLTAKKKFDILDGAIACILFIALNFVFDIFYGFFPRDFRVNFWGNALFSVILESIFAIICLIVVCFRHKNFIEATTLNKKVNWPIVGLCLAISAACILLFSDITNAYSYTLDYIGYIQYPDPITNTPHFVLTYFLNIITVCAVPALCEELLFRGVLLNSFRGLNKWLGITVSAFAFMLMHGNPEQTVHQLLLGFVLGYIVWETRNLWTSILIHFFNNFLAITLSFILTIARGGAPADSGAAETISSQRILLTWLLGIAMVALGLIIVWWLVKFVKKQSQKANGEVEQKKVDVVASVDGEVVQADVSAEIQETKEVAEEKQTPTPTAKYLTIVAYLLFAAKCVYDWISILLYHLP
ncbi:MAG: CPBP family intramembrane metalloprotease [Clostridia bacterium]|nr:CPBP family intramembrane metalloprotease [Clostridia bacterium]